VSGICHVTCREREGWREKKESAPEQGRFIDEKDRKRTKAEVAFKRTMLL
jgi:hypothetical protein